jgi:hypothetical protein
VVDSPDHAVTSSPERSSISISSPEEVARSTVDDGAATTKGIPAAAHASATLTDPILFAVSPFRAMRSAPMTAKSASPLRIVEAAAPSACTT